jgi:hypothetical protein
MASAQIEQCVKPWTQPKHKFAWSHGYTTWNGTNYDYNEYYHIFFLKIQYRLGVLGEKAIWMLVSWPATEYTIRGRWWLPPSSGRGESCEFDFAHGSF